MGNRTQLDELIEEAIVKELKPIDVEERFRSFLDEVWGDVNICGYIYSTSRILEEVDPVAFRCGCNDWVDSKTGDTFTEEIRGEIYDFSEAEEIRERIEEEQEEKGK